jgi:meso-butanediol dehydrogenase / (S,S)-butanediol dehydrogenase / diacetyl reductase
MWFGMGSGRFMGKVAIVTGAASGIGTAIADRLLAEDATVVALDVSADGLERLAAERPGALLETRVADVADPVAVSAVVEEIATTLGHIDLVVPNAGVATAGRATEVSDGDWRTMFAVNVDGVFYLVRATLPHLIASGGSVVSTASISGLGGDRGMTAYNAAKGAVVNFTRSLAVDYGHDGVRVNAVAPGFIATPASLRVLDARPGVEDIYRDRIPLGRIGQPAEIAAAVAFLASADASYITGVTLTVDGGLTASTGQPSLL